jgi:ornithine cyclodeaminase
MHTLSEEDITRLMPMPEAIGVVAAAFAAISRNDGLYPPRLHLPLRGGDALVMPGYDGGAYLGTKIVTVHPAAGGQPGTRASYLLLSADDARPLLLCDGTALTALRTGAAAGLATRRLARDDARTLALFGVGGQAPDQLAAMAAVRPIERVRVVARDPRHADAFISRVRARFPGVHMESADASFAIAGADIVVAATNSMTPVFDGAMIAPGTHVNAIGSYRPQMREFDDALARRARIVVDQREAALAESGELIRALAQDLVTPGDIRELGELPEHARRSADEITLFKTVGHAALDLFTAVALLERLH